MGDLCKINRGKVISKEYLHDHAGNYPVFSSQTANSGILGKINSYDYNGTYITWTTDGANAGHVFYRDEEKFSITNVCGIISLKNDSEMNFRFLYYILQKNAKKYVSSGMGNPKLMSNVMETIKVPIPSLAEQTRIVTILDHFDTLTTSLTEGLPREIALRQQQYEYYRDLLLSFPPSETRHAQLQTHR